MNTQARTEPLVFAPKDISDVLRPTTAYLLAHSVMETTTVEVMILPMNLKGSVHVGNIWKWLHPRKSATLLGGLTVPIDRTNQDALAGGIRLCVMSEWIPFAKHRVLIENFVTFIAYYFCIFRSYSITSSRDGCVHRNLRCDGVQDCKNGKDEQNCVALSKKVDQFMENKY